MESETKRGLPASLWFLFAAIGLYGLAGSPTPDQPGLVEAAMGLLLIFSIGAAGLSRSLTLSPSFDGGFS